MKAILCLVMLAACGGAQRDSESLAESIRTFNDGVRWQRFERAATQVPVAQRTRFVEDMDERAETLKITDYEIVSVDNRGPREARVRIKLSWYQDTEGTLHETHAMQTWERPGKVWMMVDESRVRGAEMPGLADSADSAGVAGTPVPERP